MDPGHLARLILRASDKRNRRLYPGIAAKLAALAGSLAPKTTTELMRRVTFEKLEGNVW